ncbi:MAG: hypothetical protein ACK4GL_12770, partial [Flavobacteriales bacterium]
SCQLNFAGLSFLSFIHFDEKELRNSLQMIETLRKDPDVLGISPKVIVQAIFMSGITDINGMISGIDVENEVRLFSFADYVT